MRYIHKFPIQLTMFREDKPRIKTLDEGLRIEVLQAFQSRAATAEGISVVMRQMAAIWDKMSALNRVFSLFSRLSGLRTCLIRVFMMILATVSFAYAENAPPESVVKPSVEVSKGENLNLGSDAEVYEYTGSIGVEANPSWREGNLVFRGESLGEVTAEISRFTSVEFIFLDENLKKVKIAGLFKAGDVEGFLRSLQDNFNISYRRDGKIKVILNRD